VKAGQELATIANMAHSANSNLLVRCVSSESGKLGMGEVAEAVETANQQPLSFLTRTPLSCLLPVTMVCLNLPFLSRLGIRLNYICSYPSVVNIIGRLCLWVPITLLLWAFLIYIFKNQ
jgi:hypothetical protein